MQTYEILVQNRAVKGNSKDMTLVRTSVGIDQVHILFDSSEWLDFPITITFAQGDELVTQSLIVTTIDSAEWVAEATVTVPYEVIDMTGPIRVTIQGTDANGRHIITAKGSPLSVEEAGDVVLGDLPADAPTVDQWQQAYSQAMSAAGAAQSVANDIEGRIDAIVREAEERIMSAVVMPIATSESAGGVIIGQNINVDENGRISVAAGNGMTNAQIMALINLSILGYTAFDTRFDNDGKLDADSVMVKSGVLPVATIDNVGAVRIDGTSVTIDSDGVIHAPQYVLPIASDTALGGVMVDGRTVKSTSGVISVPLATASDAGVVRPDGVTVTIDDGVITATGGGGDGGYVLPKASDSQLGGIKVGQGLSIDGDGFLTINLESADGRTF